jgi:hypothetical protein
VADLYARDAIVSASLTIGTGTGDGGILKSGDFNGTISGANLITANGTAGWGIDRNKAVFSNIVIRGANASIGDNAVLNNLFIFGALQIFGDGQLVGDNYILDKNGILVNPEAEFDITLGADGEITNADGDFVVNSDGFAVFGKETFLDKSAYSLFNSEASTPADAVGYLSTFLNRVQLEAQQGFDVVLVSTTGRVWLNNNRLRVGSSLPTSSSGLASGDVFTQTATQLGGSGSTKVLCVV